MGPQLANLDCSLDYVPFLPLLPSLEHLRLLRYTTYSDYHGVAKLDLGPLVEASSLRILEIDGGQLFFEHLDQLTQLRVLGLTDIQPLPGSKPAIIQLPLSLTKLELELREWF